MTSTIKLQAPPNTGGLSHGDTSYKPDANGCIDVPPEFAVFALSHGFTIVTAPPAPDDMVNFAKLNKKQLLAFAKDNLGLDLDEAKTNKELIAAIEAAMEAKV